MTRSRRRHLSTKHARSSARRLPPSPLAPFVLHLYTPACHPLSTHIQRPFSPAPFQRFAAKRAALPCQSRFSISTLGAKASYGSFVSRGDLLFHGGSAAGCKSPRMYRVSSNSYICARAMTAEEQTIRDSSVHHAASHKVSLRQRRNRTRSRTISKPSPSAPPTLPRPSAGLHATDGSHLRQPHESLTCNAGLPYQCFFRR